MRYPTGRVSWFKPAARLEERVIDVAGRNEAEHEQAQHNHYLLLHNGQTQHTLVVEGRGYLRAPPLLEVTDEVAHDHQPQNQQAH